jgi:simple sugar transport system permease protein
MRHHKEDDKLVYTLAALFLSFLLCAVFLLVLGHNPLKVYLITLEGSLGNSYSICKSLAKATPLIFTGLSVFFADQAGLFNIGAEGQLLVGGVASGIFGYMFSMMQIPPILSLFLCLVLSFLAGALWGAIPGWLKARYGANEFIVSMMLNYVASYLCEYLVTYPFRGPGVTAKTNQMPANYQLPRLVQGTQLNAGFFLGLFAIVLVYLFFRYTTRGLEIRAMGKNQTAALASGVNTTRETVFVFSVAGGLAALAGATEVLGIHGFFINDLSPGYGFDGIAVSVLAQGNSWGVLFSSLLFGALRAGGSRLDLKSKVPSEFIIVLQAVVIVFIATPQLIAMLRPRKKEKADNA